MGEGVGGGGGGRGGGRGGGGGGGGGEGGGADIEGRLGTQGDFCSLKQLLEETSLLFCFLLTPFLLFVLAKDMYKNVF